MTKPSRPTCGGPNRRRDNHGTVRKSVAIDFQANANASNATALGNNAQALATGATAIGLNASATGQNAVALGQGSVADVANTVSVGSPGNERRIVNVAPGTLAANSCMAAPPQAAAARPGTPAPKGNQPR
jgi:autotransporter adhesin